MGKTSSSVKNRYNAKAYIRWSIMLKPELAEAMDRERGEIGKNEFVRFLFDQYMTSKQSKQVEE